MRRFATISIIVLIAVWVASALPRPALGYHLPPYRMSPEEDQVPAEDTLGKYQAELDRISVHVPLNVADTRRKDYKTKLSPKAKRMIKGYDETRQAQRFWKYVVTLKRDLIALQGNSQAPAITIEADAMAKAVIQRIYDLSKEYEVAFSALVNNTLINLGLKDKGLCYHYVNDIRKALKRYDWKHFDLHWGEAWPKTYFENNALIITARDEEFDTGIAIDVWRSAGEPFWTPVKGDRYPWQELFNVEANYEVE